MLLNWISYEELLSQYEKIAGELPPIIVWAVPVMLSLVALEFVFGQWKKRKLYAGKDFLASAGIGVGNLLVTAVTKTTMFTIVFFCMTLVPWRIPTTWWSFILCLVILDFFRYWAHRIAHEQRWLWSTHVTHHSSEQYNFSVSFRLSWFQHVKLVFFLPVAFMGFDPIVFFICHQIEVLYQFWIHTELIGKLPAPFEFILTTPSHHRVHHAKNAKYIDKNYGSTFIIWDRMFGTFQEEEERPDYGITVPPNSFNPVFLVFHELRDVVRDAMKAKNWQEFKLATIGRPGAYHNHKLKEAEEAAKQNGKAEDGGDPQEPAAEPEKVKA